MLYMFRGPLEEITGRNRPNTPGDERIRRAFGRIEFARVGQTAWAVANTRNAEPQETRDAETMAEWYNGQAHRMRALAETDSMELKDPDDQFDFLCDMAEEAESETMMGLSVIRDIPEYESELTEINFDAVPRDPEWMGISYTWSFFRRTNVMVAESRVLPGDPGMIIGMPHQNIGENFKTGPRSSEWRAGRPWTLTRSIVWRSFPKGEGAQGNRVL